MDIRSEILKTAYLWYGKPYVWGGDDPSGFDCSGFVIEVLQSVGIIKDGLDYTANGLFKLFERYPRSGDAKPGDLVFWFTGMGHSLKAVHIEIMVDEERSIGASGSGSPKFSILGEVRNLTSAVPVLAPLFLDELGRIRKDSVFYWLLEKALFNQQAERDNGFIKIRPISRRPNSWICDPTVPLGG